MIHRQSLIGVIHYVTLQTELAGGHVNGRQEYRKT